MATYRVHKEGNYSVICNGFLKRKDLSWKAKGVLAYLLHLPDDWELHFDELKQHATDGKSSLRTGINELREEGYIVYNKYKDKEGKFVHEYDIYEYPQTEKPDTENPDLENPDLDNRHILLSTNEQNTNKPTTNSNSSKDSCYLDGNDWPRPSELPRNNQNHRIYPKEFEDLYNVYPDRPNEDKGRAYKKVRARINEGINYVDLGKAAMNYSKYCDIEDKAGTKYVKMMSTFFGESDPWVEFQDYDFGKVDKEDPEGFDQLKEIWGELEEEEEFIDG